MCLFKKKNFGVFTMCFCNFFLGFLALCANVKNNMCESHIFFKDYDFKINACESSNVYRNWMILRFIMQLRMINLSGKIYFLIFFWFLTLVEKTGYLI